MTSSFMNLNSIVQNNRNQLFDILKGITIFMVIYGHMIVLYDIDYMQSEALLFIYMFHMPLFIFISGYFLYPSVKKTTIKEWLKKKFYGILLPSITYGTVISSKLLIGMYSRNAVDWDSVFKLFIHGLWFLPVLFILCIIAKFIECQDKISKPLLWCIFIVGTQFLPEDLIFNGLKALGVFFCLGILSKYYQSHIVDFYQYYRTAINIGVFALFFIAYRSFNFEHTLYVIETDYDTLQYWRNFAIRTLSGVTGIASCFIVGSFIDNKNVMGGGKFKSCMSYLGVYSLQLYSIHVYLYYLLLSYLNLQTNNLLLFLIYSIVVTILSLALIRIISKNRFTNKLFFGK